METKNMKKTQITLSLVLASFLVVGLAASLSNKKALPLSADAAFEMTTNLDVKKQICVVMLLYLTKSIVLIMNFFQY